MAGKRKKGEGTVRLRKDGRWEGRVVVGYDEAGNPKTKNVLAKTKKECAEKLEQLKEQCGGLPPRPSPAGDAVRGLVRVLVPELLQAKAAAKHPAQVTRDGSTTA